MIELVLNNCTKGRVPSRAVCARICEEAQHAFKLPKGVAAEVGITFVNATRIRTLNRNRRGIDTPTDVLSFPLHMDAQKGYTSVLLGDLFICPDVVGEHAKESGLSVRDQMQWTIVHGLLHLAGYDHERSTADEKTMRAAEKKILNRLST
ncbi:MAG: rRNA maturation RNase YbeY [Candidatus Pacebacteria bacterium]|nr:rRNA maturation RNase YbeY [Candidatus Paceibacterota bacterium]